MVPNSFTRRYAFDLGRAENEFRWSVVNAGVGGVDGSSSVAVLDQVGVALEAVAAGRLPSVRREIDEIRADWRDHLATEGDWRQAYRNAFDVFTEGTLPPLSPSERVLAYLWSFVDKYHRDLERLVQLALLLSGEEVRAAHALGLVLDQGVRPPVSLDYAEIAPALGYTAPGQPPRLPTLREFIREQPNPEHAAWRERRAAWPKRRGTTRPFDEPEPPARTPVPNPRRPGDLPPATSWRASIRILWEKAGLDRYRNLPDSIESVPDAAPPARVALVTHIAELAHDAFDEMRSVRSAGVGTAPQRPEDLPGLAEREYGAKLTGCTKQERLSFIQYQVAAAGLASPQGGGGDGAWPKDRTAYDWLKANSDGSVIWTLPDKFDTWARYLRAARKKVGAPKNRPRHGREGRSIVRPDGAG